MQHSKQKLTTNARVYKDNLCSRRFLLKKCSGKYSPSSNETQEKQSPTSKRKHKINFREKGTDLFSCIPHPAGDHFALCI